jgi:hypothetical protein
MATLLKKGPDDFFFKVEPVAQIEATHRNIVFRVGILS